MKHTALVVLSGGQDSITCLGLAIKNHTRVEAISFDYSQRQAVELRCAQEVCKLFDIPHKVVKIDFLQHLVTSALLNDSLSVNNPHPRLTDLPATFVPTRNALFLTIAHGFAQEIQAGTIYTGVCQTDYSGYPDCRQGFISALKYALNIGYNSDIKIETPLMNINKEQTWELAESLGWLDIVIKMSHTCYEGVRDELHEWGYGCGLCPACDLRIKGFNDFMKRS